MKQIFYSFSHSKGFGNATCLYSEPFNFKKAEKDIEKENDLEGVVILYFKEIARK